MTQFNKFREMLYEKGCVLQAVSEWSYRASFGKVKCCKYLLSNPDLNLMKIIITEDYGERGFEVFTAIPTMEIDGIVSGLLQGEEK